MEQFWAAQSLAWIGEAAVGPLIEALGDEDWEVRRNAAWALGEMKEERAVEALIGALGDDRASVRIRGRGRSRRRRGRSSVRTRMLGRGGGRGNGAGIERCGGGTAGRIGSGELVG